MECSSHVFILHIWLLSTFLTSCLACSLLVISHIVLSTVCVHWAPSCPWAFALAVLSTLTAVSWLLNAGTFSFLGSHFRKVFCDWSLAHFTARVLKTCLFHISEEWRAPFLWWWLGFPDLSVVCKAVRLSLQRLFKYKFHNKEFAL